MQLLHSSYVHPEALGPQAVLLAMKLMLHDMIIMFFTILENLYHFKILSKCMFTCLYMTQIFIDLGDKDFLQGMVNIYSGFSSIITISTLNRGSIKNT